MNWFTTYDLLKRNGPFTFAVDYIIWYIVVAIAAIVGIYFLNKYKTEKRVKIVLIVLWAVAVALDLTKLIVNICEGFSIGGDLPLYVCSLFLYIMPVALWGKGVFKTMAMAYICSISLFGAFANYAMPSVVEDYSLFSFRGFHTTLYHTILVLVPLIILCTGSFKFKFKDFGWQILGFVVVTLPVVFFNYIADCNYMYFNEGVIIEDVAAKMSYAWPLLLYVIYAAIMILMQLIIMGITKLVEIMRAAIQKRGQQPKAATDGATK